MQRLRSDVRLLLHRSGASNLRQRLLLHLRLIDRHASRRGARPRLGCADGTVLDATRAAWPPAVGPGMLRRMRRRTCSFAVAGVLASALVAVAACSSTAGQPSRDAARDVANSDAASPGDALLDRACVQTENTSICAPIVTCQSSATSDAGLHGPVFNLDGCDAEGTVCTGACDVSCTCTSSFWRCDFPVGKPCSGGSCSFLQNYGGGASTHFSAARPETAGACGNAAARQSTRWLSIDEGSAHLGCPSPPKDSPPRTATICCLEGPFREHNCSNCCSGTDDATQNLGRSRRTDDRCSCGLQRLVEPVRRRRRTRRGTCQQE